MQIVLGKLQACLAGIMLHQLASQYKIRSETNAGVTVLFFSFFYVKAKMVSMCNHSFFWKNTEGCWKMTAVKLSLSLSAVTHIQVNCSLIFSHYRTTTVSRSINPNNSYVQFINTIITLAHSIDAVSLWHGTLLCSPLYRAQWQSCTAAPLKGFLQLSVTFMCQ